MNSARRTTAHQRQQLAAVARWNEQHSVGTTVTVELDSGEIRTTTTRSQAEMLGGERSKNHPGHMAVIWVEGISGCYALSRVRAKLGDE